jgi:hypothetical protein
MGTLSYEITFPEGETASFADVRDVVNAIKRRAADKKLVGEERQVFYAATLVEQVAANPGSSHRVTIHWQVHLLGDQQVS